MFTGYVDRAVLPPLMAGATVFAFPSAYEGFGFPVLEAMKCDTPVVVSDRSALPEVAGDAAAVVPCDRDALAAAISRLLLDPAARADLVTRGRARAAEFTWERTARETAAVYDEVASDG
jgi:glycosyltransferase involved in cell wall biosynthesis